MKTMATLLPNFAPGPLDRYRKIASFDWKKLKIFMETEEIIRFKDTLLQEFKNNSAFDPPQNNLSFDELRRRSIRNMHIIKNIPNTTYLEILDNVDKSTALYDILFQLDPSATVKFSLNYGMFYNVLQVSGSDRHSEIMEKSMEGKVIGCFCLTEIGHGTNTKAMRTKATYNQNTKQFIMHSPDFEAAKCWAGMLGQGATHAIVYAQLYTSDDVCHGLHAFLVHIRDEHTLIPKPGVIVGDMGEKIGLNGVDNGYLMFDNFKMPREALLNKLADVTEDGRYVTPFKDPNKRFGASLGALSNGRVYITNICASYLTKGITIAVRYGAVRKQFGPDGEDEIPILEYQLHQHRLLPYLAAAFAMRNFAKYIMKENYQFNIDMFMGNMKPDKAASFGFEMHGVSSACKPVGSWTTRDGLQECREACAGHGYLKAAGIGDVRNDHDANSTYEGENHVLIQQTSNWLLKYWPVIMRGERFTSPMHSIDFLSDAKQILGDKFVAESITEISRPEYILRMYQWLVSYLLKSTYNKHEQAMKDGKGSFWARNDNQVFYARTLGVAFIQHFILQRLMVSINEIEDPACKNVMVRMFGLYGLFSIEKHIGHMYQGGYFVGEKPATILQDAILELCKSLKDDAVSLVDVIAADDYLINSVLGKSDGKVYDHLKSSMVRPENIDRPTWWKDILNWESYIKAKL